MEMHSSIKTLILSLIFSQLTDIHSIAGTKKGVCLNESDFRDKVYACWLGKNIGGTLGMPFEGDTVAHDLVFYTKLKEGEPAANDDLDLQILWLKAMEENNGHVDAFTLGKYWLKYVPVNWNEYGVGKANMKAGLMPPVSGEFNNARWKHSNGAWIRSEIWACLFPGQPMMAVKFAREDACVDHGMSEGTFAELFTASLESAAFFEHDRDSLLRFALTMIPADCRVARAVKKAIQAQKEGKDWKQARLAVIGDTKDMGWFQAPRNVAFTIIGWLYGEGNFGKSICIAVNCGDDTDCTGATLGSILGIIGGTKAIPENWRKPVGNKIATVAIKGFEAPATLDILTDSTVAMTRKVLVKYNLPVEIGTGITEYEKGRQLIKTDKKALEKLWQLSPWRVARHNRDWVILFDYLTEPVIRENTMHKLVVSISNITGKKEIYRLKVSGLPEKWEITGIPANEFSLKKNSKRSFELSFLPESIQSDTIRMNLELVRGTDSDSVPFTFFKRKP
jgi:ADP-ribosylglycohydrolase